MPTTEVTTDTADEFGWSTKTITTDDDGRILSTVIDYDDGNRFSETFDPDRSVLTRTFEDLSDLKRFESRSDSYFVDPDTGEMMPYVLARTLVSDTGFKEEWDYERGTYTKTDVDDLAAWTRIHDDGEGWITTEYDDGSTRVEQNLGFATLTTYRDADATLTLYVEKYFDSDGALTQTSVSSAAKQKSTIHYYTDGALVAVNELFEDGNPSAIWQRLTTYAPDGATTGDSTIFRDGRKVLDFYEEGVLIERQVTDVDNAFDWSSITSEYTANGDIGSREIVNDDGSMKITTRSETTVGDGYTVSHDEIGSNGQSTRLVSTSYDADGNRLSTQVVDHVRNTDVITRYQDGKVTSVSEFWEQTAASGLSERNTSYDTNGEIILIDTANYDGRITYDYFEDGILFEREVVNTTSGSGTFKWESISTAYDSTGQKTENVIVYLDGRVRTDTYEDGKLVSKVLTDTADTKNWEEQRTIYAESGGIARRETLDDNGIETVKSYEGRTLRELSRTDTEDTQDWTTIINTYGSFGDLLRSHTTYDNQDQMVYVAEDRRRIELDGDGSDSWLFRTTEFVPGKGKSITTYDSVEDAPSFILDEFAIV